LTRLRAPAADTLEQRLAHSLRLTGGTMRLTVVVKDDCERAQALRYLAGRIGGHLIELETQDESAAKRKAWRERGERLG